MPYRSLGPRRIDAKDTATAPGTWTAVFTPAELNVSVPEFEIFRIVVETAANTASVKVRIGIYTFSVGPVGAGAEWDPNQPALVQLGQTISVLFSQKTSVTPIPKVTLWLRYAT